MQEAEGTSAGWVCWPLLEWQCHPFFLAGLLGGGFMPWLGCCSSPSSCLARVLGGAFTAEFLEIPMLFCGDFNGTISPDRD